MNLGVRILDRQNAVAAMAIKAFGCICIAQRADLTMVSGLVRLVIVFVATAATRCDRQLDRPDRGVADLMG